MAILSEFSLMPPFRWVAALTMASAPALTANRLLLCWPILFGLLIMATSKPRLPNQIGMRPIWMSGRRCMPTRSERDQPGGSGEECAAALLLALVDCTAFDQPDQRGYCQALEQHNSGHCYSIYDADLRNQCRAEVHGEKSLCYPIANATERAECQMRANHR
jgi:hypothetical protein